MAYFINRIFRKSGPLEKTGRGPKKKSGPNANIHCIGQKHPYDKLEVADFNSLNIQEYVQLCLNIVCSVYSMPEYG